MNHQSFELGADVSRASVRRAFWAGAHDQPGQDIESVRIEVHTAMRYQTMAGIGGSFSEIGGAALGAASESDRQAVLQQLFGRNGAAFGFCRLPIGASDFALDAYSLNDHPDDRSMAHFSIERDERHLIPFIDMARRVNPYLRLHASPWSPPGWMKTTGTIDRGGRFIDTAENRDAYALYLRKFIEAYREHHGIEIARLCVQNEPDSVTAEPDEKMFPACLIPPQTMVPLVVDHLAPTFAEAKLSTELWAGTFRTISGLQAHRCMVDAGFRRAIAGCAFQYALPEYLDEFTRCFPGVPIMHTESVCFNGDNTPVQAAALFEDFVRYVRAGCDVYTYWNMILDERRTSTWGWRQNSLFVIDRNSGQVTAQPDFGVMRLLSGHIPPGAQRIEAFCFVRPTIAFARPDGTIVVFIWNDGPARTLEVVVDQKTHHVDAPGHALVAIVLEAQLEGAPDG